jgi:hypothetical protein
MKKVVASLVVIALVGLAAAGDGRPAAAQGFNISGVIGNNKNKDEKQANNDDKDNDQNASDNSNNQGNRRSKSNKNSDDKNANPLEQFLSNQGTQSGSNSNNQNSSNKYRRSNQQGNFNNQQFDNFQQGNQNSITIGSWNSGKWQGSRKIDSWTKQFGGNQQPFSSQWYKDHPQAWKYDNNKANIWVTASLPGVYGWLGWGNVPQQYQGNYGNAPQFDTSYYGQWYPLGVFSLMSGPGDSGTRIVQLAVDRSGRVAGNYYDMITNSSYNISGDVSRQSQRVQWSLNKNQFVRFRAPIYQLLQPYGSLTVQLPGGQQQWQFVRLEN